MADGVPITAGSGTTIATDDTGANGHVQIVKIAYSADGSSTHVSADAGGLLVNLGANNDVTVTDGGSSLTVDGTVAATQSGSWTVTANAGTGPFPVSDNSGSLTVDAPVGTPVFVRLSDGTSAVATLPVSLASVPSHDIVSRGPSSFASGQVSVSTTATTLVASRSGRSSVILLNYGICTVYVGPATVTTSNGIALDPGATLTLSTSALIQGIAPAGFNGIVHYVEEY